ncbi:murein L,D-transpeptidase catalytic domain family protein [Hymenobacter sp. M29]|uniref:Murein L,D-transpeptidase catalytic domain family protein n=1 Tax=Hymenobacter mellowenesis TaxID=3063995 RepID=A0ABT9AJK9_9BACT|nr:murein L,D-transpeptidase catalytic domain family protein [Hymenobacter sp. M29]MDO7849572.1 murein L,D-transpeptidase catalytic domain family protein [Hymenobacter sp. M29]
MLALVLAYIVDCIGLATYYKIKFWVPVIAKHPTILDTRKMIFSNPFYNQHYVLLVNMKLSSSVPRMQILDIANSEVVFRTRVMHGKNSGGQLAVHFSNLSGSNMTSLGRYVIVGQYSGKYGKAYRLAGLDATNSNALSRSIVLHQSRYFGFGKIGRSEGCPAVSKKAMIEMTPYLKTGTLIWVYK